jgi:hypothetical protein
MLTYNDIVAGVESRDLMDLANAIALEYGLEYDDALISSMYYATEIYDEMPDDFVAWTYICGMLDGLCADFNDVRIDEYLSDPDSLKALLGTDTFPLADDPDAGIVALAYARCRLIIAAPYITNQLMEEKNTARAFIMAFEDGAYSQDILNWAEQNARRAWTQIHY